MVSTTSAERMRAKRVRDAVNDFVAIWMAGSDKSNVEDFIEAKKSEFDSDHNVVIACFDQGFIGDFREVLVDLNTYELWEGHTGYPEADITESMKLYTVSALMKSWKISEAENNK